MNTTRRFESSTFYKFIERASPIDKQIVICGLGGIGSNTFYNISKSLPNSNITLIDFDLVEEHNIGTQYFTNRDLNMFKTNALKNKAENFKGVIETLSMEINEYNSIPVLNNNLITIACFDNMEARTNLFNIWRKNTNPNKIFIEGRLAATQYEIYSVLSGREEEYTNSLFKDDEITLGKLCTFQQTAHYGMAIGSRITQIICNHLSNIYHNEKMYRIPFYYREIGDLFNITIKD